MKTIQTKRNIYNLDASPNVRPRWKNVASPPKKGNSYMCTSVQKKGIMFRMVPDQFLIPLIIVRKNLKNPPGRLKQRKILVLRIWSGDYPPPVPG